MKILTCIAVGTLLTLNLVTFLFLLDLVPQKNLSNIYKPKEVLDFSAFYTAAHIINSGEVGNLYNQELQLKVQNEKIPPPTRSTPLTFRNPPIVGYLFLPFSVLDYSSSYKLFLLMNLLIICFALVITCKTFEIKNSVALVVGGAFYPLFATLYWGQISSLVFLGISLSFYFYKKKLFLFSGVFASLVFVKPQFLLFLPLVYFGLKAGEQRKLFFLGAFGALLVVALTSVLLLGSDGVWAYPKFVTSTERLTAGTDTTFLYTISGAFYKFFGRERGFIPGLITSAAVYSISLLKLAKKSFKQDLLNPKIILIIVLTTLLTSMHALIADYLSLIIPILLFLKKPKWVALFLFVFSSILADSFVFIGSLMLTALLIRETLERPLRVGKAPLH
ncbi:MAG: glycosyltransferase family 87 protein [Patescibacteria group bacterium]